MALSIATLAGVAACGPQEGGTAGTDGKGATGREPRGGTKAIEAAGAVPRAQDGGSIKFEFEQGCQKVKAALERFLDKGLDSIGCWESVKSPEPVGQKAEEISTRAGEQCQAQPGRWWYTRKQGCGKVTLTYTVIDLRTKRPTGRAVFTAEQEFKLSSATGRIRTKNSLRLDAATGTAKGLRAAWTTSCTGGACGSSSAWAGKRPIRVRQELRGSTAHTWKAGTAVQSFGTKTTVAVVGTGQVLIAPAWFRPSMKIRCDKTFNSDRSPDGKSRGCVFPSQAPVLKLRLSHEGHANVAWSMNNLKGHWGWYGRGKPLHREASESVRKKNRGKICDSTFKPDPQVPDDSCDEFPFAATKESGGRVGLRGKDCAEIRPEKKNGKWLIHYVNNVTPSSRCTIGHVPNKPNGSVGGSLSLFHRNQRVLDGEKYWISVR
ncbi:NucA/NucB deoxyribonuclease domain-containing protein [Streptomyces sp. NPDC002851]